MDIKKGAGIFAVLVGLIFIIFPMFSSELISVIVGLSLLFFGISAAFMGWNIRELGNFSLATIIIGIIAVIFGFIFIFYIDALPFLIGLQFYIVGFIMIIFGIVGIISRSEISTLTSILIIILGIIAIALAAFAMSKPIYVAIIIGIVSIIQGVEMILSE